MSDPVTPRDLALMLADDIEAVVEKLRIDVKRRSRRKLYAFAPWNNHHSPKLEIELHPRPGKWNDWIGGVYGDALDLVAATLCDGRKDLAARKKAMTWAREHFGLVARGFDAEAWRRRMAATEARASAREARAAAELARHRRAMFGRWVNARPLTKATDGWRYLAARGIELDHLPRLPRAIKFSAEERWTDETGEVRHVGPALLSAMTLPDGAFGSLHRIWINPEAPGQKADVSPPRKMWPSSEGAAIRLWRGSTRLSPADAAARPGHLEDVVVCEGVEDGLSIALMVPELRVDAAGSLPGLLSYVPYPFTRRLIVAADNDWGKPQAKALLDRACQRLASEFKVELRIARSPIGKDFNDCLRGAA